MSKETIKLYAPRVEKNAVEIMEVLKDTYKENKQAYLDLGLFETYKKAKKQLDFEINVSKLITNHIEIRVLKTDIARLEEQLAIPNCDDKVKKDITNLKNDLDVIRKLDKLEDHRFELIDKEQVHFSERIEQLGKDITMVGDRFADFRDSFEILNCDDRVKHLERKLNGKDNRLDALSDKIDNIKKESKRGEDLLLDRIKELERDLENNRIGIKYLGFAVIAISLALTLQVFF